MLVESAEQVCFGFIRDLYVKKVDVSESLDHLSLRSVVACPIEVAQVVALVCYYSID